jgi:ASC-1-like (ASCH) protein
MKPYQFTIAVAVVATLTVAINVPLFAANSPPRGKSEADALEIATNLKDKIEKAEQECVKNEEAVFQALDQSLGKLSADNLQSIQENIEGIREVAKVLLALANKLLAERSKILLNTDKLNTLNKEAIAISLKTAEMFEEKAKEEPFEDLKKDHLMLADAWRRLAEIMEKRAENMASDTQKVAEVLLYIERTKLLLELILRHIEVYPNLKQLAEQDRFRGQIRHYIEGFERFRAQFRKFDETLRTDALSANLRPAGPGPHPSDIIDKGPRYAQQVESAKSVAAPAKKTATVLASKKEEAGYSHALLFPLITAPFVMGLLYAPLCRRKKRLASEQIAVSEEKPRPIPPRQNAPLLDNPQLPPKQLPKQKPTISMERLTILCMAGKE